MLDFNTENKINELIGKMTLREKVGQLNQIPSPSEDNEEIFEMLRRGEIGSFIMSCTAHAFSEDSVSANEAFINKLHDIAVNESRLGIPVIFGRDVIHGHYTVLPTPLAIASSFDPELVRECYGDVAAEAARDGIQWTFTPMLDLSRDPRWGRCVEGPGEDPYVGERMARAVVEGLQGDDPANERSIAACAKHYIGYGASEGGRDYHKTDISDYTLRNFYLRAFKAAVDSGVLTVMNSFNEIGGQPVASSRYLLTDVLRGELGFEGFVVSDWYAVKQLINQGVAENGADAAKLSLLAGVDLDMSDKCYIDHLETLVENGDVPIEAVNEAVRRILRVKFRLGLFENHRVPVYKQDKAAHAQRAERLAAESMVLLKNDGGVLPLNKNARIVALGPMVNEKRTLLGIWSLDGNENHVISIAEGVRERLEGGVLLCDSTDLEDERLAFIRDADVALLCIGESRMLTGEAASKARPEVSPAFVELAKEAKKRGKPVVALMAYARPVAIEELEPYCDAILYTWHPGTTAGRAIADILFGDVNPSGKLAMTMPRTTGQIPIYYNEEPSGRLVNGYWGQEDPERNYYDCACTPMYPFGYGLSYSEFEYSDGKADKAEISLEDLRAGKCIKASVKVKNVSEVGGKEVVQLYIRDKVSKMTRPVRELRGFEKVYIEAGEEKTVEFGIGFDELAYYDNRGKLTVETGEFEVYMGGSCMADVKFCIKVK